MVCEGRWWWLMVLEGVWWWLMVAGGLDQGSWGLGRVSKGLGGWGLERAEGLGPGG